jgi:excisionase family DNA binding protein
MNADVHEVHWWSNEQVAERLNVPLRTVLDWRRRGVGPQGAKFGRHVRYSEAAVREFEKSCTERRPA